MAPEAFRRLWEEVGPFNMDLMHAPRQRRGRRNGTVARCRVLFAVMQIYSNRCVPVHCMRPVYQDNIAAAAPAAVASNLLCSTYDEKRSRVSLACVRETFYSFPPRFPSTAVPTVPCCAISVRILWMSTTGWAEAKYHRTAIVYNGPLGSHMHA